MVQFRLKSLVKILTQQNQVTRKNVYQDVLHVSFVPHV